MPNRKRLFVTILVGMLIPLVFVGQAFSQEPELTSSGNLWSIGDQTANWTEIFYDDGYVGVGTTDPDRPLTVQAYGDGSEWISLMDTGGQTKWHINGHNDGINFARTGVQDGALFVGYGPNAQGVWQTMVGVGTTVPQAQLHFKAGSAEGQGEPFLFESAHSIGARARFKATATDGSLWDIGVTAYGATGEDGGGKFMIRDGSPGVNMTRVVIDTNGNMGIGVMSPKSRLHVQGPIQLNEPTTGNQVPCDNDHRGAIIYENDQFCGCKSNGWVRLDSSGEMCALLIKE